MFCSSKSIYNQQGELVLLLDKEVKDVSLSKKTVISIGWNDDGWYIFHDKECKFEIPNTITNGFIIDDLIFVYENGIFIYTKYGQKLQHHPMNASICKNSFVLPSNRLSISKPLRLKNEFYKVLYHIEKGASTIQKIEQDVNGILKQVHRHLSECVNLKYDLQLDDENKRVELIKKSIAQYLLLGYNQVMSFYIQTHVTIQSYQKHFHSLLDLFEQWTEHHLELKQHWIQLIKHDKALFAFTMEWGQPMPNDVVAMYNKQITAFKEQHLYFTCILEYFNWMVHLVQEEPKAISDDKKLILFCKMYNVPLCTIQQEPDENRHPETYNLLFKLPEIEFIVPSNLAISNCIPCTINEEYLIQKVDETLKCIGINEMHQIPYKYEQGILKFNGKYLCHLDLDHSQLTLKIINTIGKVIHESILAKNVYQFELFAFEEELAFVINHKAFIKSFQDLMS